MTIAEVRALDSSLPKNAGKDLSAAVNSIRAFQPDLPETRDKSGYSAIIYFAGLDKNDKKLDGVDKLVLLFFDDKLVHITASYIEPSYWQEVLETAGPLRLPRKEGYARGECQGFTGILFRYPDRFTLYLTVRPSAKKDNSLPSSSAGSSARVIQNEVENSASRVAEIIQKAEHSFKNGKLNLGAGKRNEARDDFDQAVDEILTSGVDVRASQELQSYYLDLLERIYREEVPAIISSRQANAIELVAQNGQSTAPYPMPQIGFVNQKMEPSPLDDLSKPILTPEKTFIPQESPGASYKTSLEKLLVSYQRSVRNRELRLTSSQKLYTEGRILKSQVDEAHRAVELERDKVKDTRKKIAAVDKQFAAALAVAKQTRPVAESTATGQAPSQFANGQVPAVTRYLQDHLNDPYSMKLLKWSKVQKVTKYGASYWYVSLRMRAKNGFGAYILKDTGFYIRHNKVVFTENL